MLLKLACIGSLVTASLPLNVAWCSICIDLSVESFYLLMKTELKSVAKF